VRRQFPRFFLKTRQIEDSSMKMFGSKSGGYQNNNSKKCKIFFIFPSMLSMFMGNEKKNH